MKKISLLIFLIIGGISYVHASCTNLNPVITEVNNGTGYFTFDISYTNYETFYIESIDWDFDDGVTVSNNSASMPHQFWYTSSTVFNVSATVNFKDTLNKTFSCLVGIDVVVGHDLPPIPCPVATFRANSECPSGEVDFAWSWCQTLSYENGETASSYWTLDYSVWDFGDGSSETILGTATTNSHSYSSSGSFPVTVVAYYTGDSGEICSVPVAEVDGTTDPCDFVEDPTINHTFYQTVTPSMVDPSLYFTPASGIQFCGGNTFSVYNFGQVVGSSPPYSNWSYELFLDGSSVATGSGIPDNTSYIYQTSLNAGDYAFEIVYTYTDVSSNLECSASYSEILTIDTCAAVCDSCTSFKPFAGERYWLSAWVKEDHANQVLSYTDAHINLGFTGAGTSVDFYPQGEIIEGWQRIVGEFTIPSSTTELDIDLINSNSSVNAYFDDIRIHPFNASMKSYVYDPETFWLTAELDDNNYATFYEYDKEGQLIRIKKETARGVMTIQESRSSNPKK